MERKRKPWLGLVGLVLLLGGVFLSCQRVGWGVALGAVGGLVLIYALVTGNVTLFGR